jgi:hypothetical protein
MTGDSASESQHLHTEPRPPLLVKVTGYRLLYVMVVSAFGLSKAVMEYNGKSLVSTTLDWIMGVVLAIAYVTIFLKSNRNFVEYCAGCIGLACMKVPIPQYGHCSFIETTLAQSSRLYRLYGVRPA